LLTIRRLALLGLAFPLVVLPTAGCSSVEGQEPAAVAPAGEENHPEGAAAEHADHGAMGAKLPVWSVLPFVVLLLCIAIMPLFAAHWWEKNHHQNKAIIAGALAAIVAIYVLYVGGERGAGVMQHVLLEYISFIILLGSLFLITGGVYVKGSLNGTPLANTGLMALGAVIASGRCSGRIKAGRTRPTSSSFSSSS